MLIKGTAFSSKTGVDKNIKYQSCVEENRNMGANKNRKPALMKNIEKQNHEKNKGNLDQNLKSFLKNGVQYDRTIKLLSKK